MSQLRKMSKKNQFISCTSKIDSSLIGMSLAMEPQSVVIAVLGTGPKTGKFTTQLFLNQYLSQIGYCVKNICTEPQAFLFGFKTLPIGNQNLLDIISMDRQIEYIRTSIFIESLAMPDIIIVGGQSGVIPFSREIVVDFNSLSSSMVMLASKPDGIVLCINPTDDVEYIERTISGINAYGYGKVLVCVMSDLIKNQIIRDGVVYTGDTHMTTEQLDAQCKIVENRIQTPVVHFRSLQAVRRCILILQEAFS